MLLGAPRLRLRPGYRSAEFLRFETVHRREWHSRGSGRSNRRHRLAVHSLCGAPAGAMHVDGGVLVASRARGPAAIRPTRKEGLHGVGFTRRILDAAECTIRAWTVLADATGSWRGAAHIRVDVDLLDPRGVGLGGGRWVIALQARASGYSNVCVALPLAALTRFGIVETSRGGGCKREVVCKVQ